MGCDTRIWLPGNVRATTVAEVLGRLVGCRALGGRETFVRVEGTNVTPASVAECAYLEINPPGGKPFKVLYHFEASTRGPRTGHQRVIMPRSVPFFIAAGVRLVDFFGGQIDFKDTDSRDVDYARRGKSDDMNCPEDGVPWKALQERIAMVEPLTMAELRRWAPRAGYNDDFWTPAPLAEGPPNPELPDTEALRERGRRLNFGDP